MRTGAKLLGSSLCSRESMKYSGPLFARKKKSNFKIYLFSFFLIALGISVWELGKKYRPTVMAGAKRLVEKIELTFEKRSPASENKK
jgi:hypothetical protein